jgi:hypothetical protein
MSFIVLLTISRDADKALNSPAEGRAQLERYVVYLHNRIHSGTEAMPDAMMAAVFSVPQSEV